MLSNWPESTYVVIPSYKAVDTLRIFIPHLLEFVPLDKICIVDDASMDETSRYCNEMNLTYISHSVNQGKGAALITGFVYCMKKHAKWIVTMDADGQHAPEDLYKFIDCVKNNESVGICIGSRCKKPGRMPPARIFSNTVTSKLLSVICGAKILDCQCGYRIYSTDLLKNISIRFSRFEMETEVIMKAIAKGYGISFVDVQTLYLKGKSHISHLADTIRWVKAVFSIWYGLRRQRKPLTGRPSRQ